MRRCLDCATLVVNGSRCPVHQRARQRAKDEARGGWDRAEIRNACIARNIAHHGVSRCELCLVQLDPFAKPGEAGALEVDHIRPLASWPVEQRARLANAPANLRVLCVGCHAGVTRSGGRGW